MSYTSLTAAANHDPGLSAFLFSEIEAFYSIAMPVSDDTQVIVDDHVFIAGEGWKVAYIIPEKHTGKATTVGSLGSQTLKNEFEIFIPGADDATLMFVKQCLNDRFITLHRDADCDNPLLYQLGNACKPARMTCDMEIGTFEPTGEKGFNIKVTWPGVIYLYAGAITFPSDDTGGHRLLEDGSFRLLEGSGFRDLE